MQTPLKLLPLLRGSRFTLPAAGLVAAGIIVISEVSYQTSNANFERLGERGLARNNIQLVLRSLIDAETGERGYLLTNRPEYLEPYEKAKSEVHRALDWLDSHYDGQPLQDAVIDRIRKAADIKLSELGETIRLHDEHKDEAWRALVLTDIGREQMDIVRTLGQSLFDDETDSVVIDRAGLGRTLQFNRIGVTVMTLLGLAAISLYLRQTTALVRQREEQRRVISEERDQLELQVLSRTGQLTELARHLQTVREDERSHLARELHDELGALLTAAKLDVARLKSRIGTPSPEVAERLLHLNETLNAGIALKRRIIEDLRPSSLSNLGLVAALDILLHEWSERGEIVVESVLEPVRLRASGELTVFRLVQEALTNISKYARANEVRVQMWARDGVVRVSVRDNGVGFDVDAPRNSVHGLLGMRYRLETEGGQLTLQSSPGKGTSIEAELPESADPSLNADAAALDDAGLADATGTR